MKREPNITRMDYGRTRAWWVRFYRGPAGGQRCTSKLFSDAVHGGKRKALAQARAWRDLTAGTVPAKLRRRGEAPGYGYVRRAELLRRVERCPAFVAWILLEGGRVASTNYSVTRWGELGAKRKCERWLAGHRRELRKRMP